MVMEITFHDGEANAIEGLTHFVLIAPFLMSALMGM